MIRNKNFIPALAAGFCALLISCWFLMLSLSAAPLPLPSPSPTGYSGYLVLSGTTGSCLTSTNSAAYAITGSPGMCLSGTNSIPCRYVVLQASASGSFIGSCGSACTVGLPANTPMTLATANACEIYVLNASTGTVNWCGF